MSARKRLEPVAAAVGAAAAVLLGSGWMSAAAATPYGPSDAAEGPEIPLGTSFVPSVGAAVGWTDNIDLAPPGEERSGEFGDLVPGISFTHGDAIEQAELNYTLHALFFTGGNHDFFHSGNLFSATQIIPEWFELDLSGIREQGLANAALPGNLTYLFPGVNIANYTTGLVKPTFKHTFHDFKAEASYTRGISEFGQAYGQTSGQTGLAVPSGQYQSNLQGANATVSSIDKNARLSWDADYQRSQVKYDSPYTLSYLYEQARGELGLLTIPTVRILGRGGAESEPNSNGLFDGGLTSTFWAAGLDRSTGPDDDLRVLVGHRFFGRTYEGSWVKDSRLLKLEAHYLEQPNTQEGLLSGESLAAPPLVTIPGTYGFTQLQPGVFLQKSLNGAATLTGRVTQIGLGVNSEQQQFYNVAAPGLVITPHSREFIPIEHPTTQATTTRFEDRYQLATLYGKRDLGPLTDLNLSASLGKTELNGLETGSYKIQRYSAVLNRRLGQWTCVYLRADHIRQYGNIAAYTMNVASIGITASLGKPNLGNGVGRNLGTMCGANGGPNGGR